MIANVNRASGTRAYKATDFMLKMRKKVEWQSVEEMQSILRGVAAQFGTVQ